MAYNESIPQASDNPSQSQAQILGNFQEISTAFNLNHGSFNSAEQGKHTFLQMPEQVSAPATLADEGALYTKAVSAITQLFWRNESNGSEQQFTNTSPTTSTTHLSWDFTNGLQIRFGTILSSDPSTVTFASAFANNAYTVFITPIGAGANTPAYNVQALSTTQFTIGSTGARTGSFYYLAIGR